MRKAGACREVAAAEAPGGGDQRLEAAQDEHIAAEPGGGNHQQGDQRESGEGMGEDAGDVGEGGLARDADTQVNTAIRDPGEQRCEGIQPRHAVEADLIRGALAPLVQDDARERRVLVRLADPFFRVGVAAEDRALAVEQRDRRAGGQLRLGRDQVEPGQIECGEHHRLQSPVGVVVGIAKNDDRLFGDPADLEVADGEAARLQGALKIGAVGDVHAADRRHRAAEHLAIRADGAEVDVLRVAGLEAGEERVAGGGVAPAHFGQAHQRAEQLARVRHQSLVIGRGQSHQQLRLAHCVARGELAALVGGVEDQPQRRQHRQQHQPQQPRAQPGKRESLHGLPLVLNMGGRPMPSGNTVWCRLSPCSRL